ncbi:NAA35 [Cordylochernes scorpioides]|uniref:Protein MAK10 homolog n=1 Tax=Cordylochernes scorpioides TaxID=51811 RepID=A0ABY6LF37_9ARAC|nr:NAA35 [Cordylochernes scorpioides]
MVAKGRDETCNEAVIGLKRDGRLPQPSSGEFDQERVRYEHRFAPLGAVLTPPPVHYSQFREASTHCPSPYLDACKCFHNAKLLLETLPDPTPEVQSLVKIAKTNFVVVKLMLGGHLKDSPVCVTDPIQFDFSQHCWFPIIKIR